MIYILKITILLSIISISLYTDMRYNKIKNKFVFPVMIIGLVLNLVEGGFLGLKSSFLGLIVPIVVLFIFFAFNQLGAGDIKLLGAMGALMGINFIINDFVYIVFTGGILAIVTFGFSKSIIGKLRNLFFTVINFVITRKVVVADDINEGRKVPFGLAIFIGTIIYLVVGYNIF